MKKYAILLSGGINYSYNYKRYKNDLSLAYRVLKIVGNFSDDNIFLFYGNGTADFSDTVLDPRPAKTAEILDCFQNLCHKLEEDDELVFVVSNHGGDENGGNICLWGDEQLPFFKLERYLSSIKAKKIVILGECFGGNILKYDIVNSCIFTANEQGKPTYADPRKCYDEFLYHFFSYILGEYPDTKHRIPQGNNNLIEAYKYARNHDIFCPNKEKAANKIGGNEIVEIPQMKNNLMDEVIRF